MRSRPRTSCVAWRSSASTSAPDFKAHLLAYFLVNTFLVAIWAVTGAGFFWPVFPILGWGIGVAFNAWDVYRRPFPTEAQIQHEIDELRDPR